MITTKPMLGQKMMYSRIVFQGFTVAAMFYDQFNGKSNHYDENNR
jgi:hypothetical protein